MVEVRIAAPPSFHAYQALRQVAVNEILTVDQLEQLKITFQHEIDSIRRRECIRTIADLIAILEKRDALSESNIEALEEIVNQCNLPSLEAAIKSYSSSNNSEMSTILHNEYRECRLAETLRENLRLQLSRTGNISKDVAANFPNNQSGSGTTVTTTGTSHVGPLSEQKRKAIYKKLSKELGSCWRNFGRELNIREGDMDNIELQFPRDIPSRIYKVIQLFEEDDCHDPKQNALILCRALDGCRRKDLRRAVEDILSH